MTARQFLMSLVVLAFAHGPFWACSSSDRVFDDSHAGSAGAAGEGEPTAGAAGEGEPIAGVSGEGDSTAGAAGEGDSTGRCR